MTGDEISILAQQIVSGVIIQSYKYYLVFLALMIIGLMSSSFIISYSRKKGESFATRTDFQNLLAQLRITTESVEQIKTDIATIDWAHREWATIRRIKLEELLVCVDKEIEYVSEFKVTAYITQPQLISKGRNSKFRC